MKRDNCFDFLRFIFAFNVVLGHLTSIAMYPELKPYTHCFNTYLSVTGFFVISGFLIAQSYNRSSSLKSYISKRARRLLPAYVLVILSCAFGLACLSSMPVLAYFCSPDWWKYLGANLCFMNFLHPSLPGVFDHPLINDTSVNGALWTLKIEVGFYLVLPLLMMWFKKSKHPWLVLFILYISAIAYRNGLIALGETMQRDMPNFLARQLPGFMSYFSCGMTAYLYKAPFLRYKNYLIIPAVVLVGLEYYWNLEILTPLAWAIIVLWCAYSLSVFNNFAKYGDISYGIYIYHVPILKTMLALGIFTRFGVWPSAALFIVLVVFSGLCSWHWLENKFLQRK